MKVEMNTQFLEALRLMEESGEPLFVTGRAGTGKSTLLHCFRYKTKKRVAVVAPTGVAALNVKGQTIHSFFGFPPAVTIDDARKEAMWNRDPELYRNLDTIVVDEISMVRADLIDAMDVFLRVIRRSALSFGGVQMIFIGDLYQLPPVVTRDERAFFTSVYPSPYFFDAHVFSGAASGVRVFELTKIYRQKDADFISLLNAIRSNRLNSTHLTELNRRVDVPLKLFRKKPICLTATNAAADAINDERLRKLFGKPRSFESVVSGEFDEKQFPTDRVLQLKTGAQVMMLNNDSEGRWVNGTLGRIVKIEKQGIRVKMQGGEEELVEKHTWNVLRYSFQEESKELSQESVGSFTQYPMRLAWAVTIHKAQGKTFDEVIVDLGRGSFAHGQTYVALSRCRTLAGLRLARPLRRSDVIMDDRVTKFFAGR